ncbi:MAG TPA: ABC transporter substrate-binding protein [Solirubrobacteraceae bacterium]|nr:ABC transporter substrate-binding protein [Solirubrobacteraceae bacterium]
MKRYVRLPAVIAAGLLLAFSAVAFGKAHTSATPTINYVEGTAPDYLDPQLGYTTQAWEVHWLTNIGLYTYAHANGQAGTKLIPGIAKAQPHVSADGKTYTVQVRSGLKYSDGTPVKAEDFAYSIERAIKLGWGGKSFYTGYIVGADAFDKGKAKSISGIKTSGSTITIKLTTAYGAFENVLALPPSGFVPSGTAMKNLSSSPPPGFGPYKIDKVVPNKSFSVDLNPNYTPIAGVPKGKANISVKIAATTQTEAESVLNNSADVFDWGDQVPPSLLSQVKAKAASRYKLEPTISTFYFFMNTQTKPFNNQLAREAVNYAIDRRAISRLNGGNFIPTCWFLPDGMVGHTNAKCPYGDPNKAPQLAKAKALVKQAGLVGTPVTVWGQDRSPRKEFVDYYAGVLKSLGFKVTEKIISSAQYWATIGNAKTPNVQTGFADWNQDFPHPADFYFLAESKSIQPLNNENFSMIKDSYIDKTVARLGKYGGSKLSSVAGSWAKLEQYTAKKAYYANYGQQEVPLFTSSKIDFGKVIFTPVYGTDWSSLSVK